MHWVHGTLAVLSQHRAAPASPLHYPSVPTQARSQAASTPRGSAVAHAYAAMIVASDPARSPSDTSAATPRQSCNRAPNQLHDRILSEWRARSRQRAQSELAAACITCAPHGARSDPTPLSLDAARCLSSAAPPRLGAPHALPAPASAAVPTPCTSVRPLDTSPEAALGIQRAGSSSARAPSPPRGRRPRARARARAILGRIRRYSPAPVMPGTVHVHGACSQKISTAQWSYKQY